MEDIDKFRKAMRSTKGNFLQLLFDRDNLLDLVELLYGAFLKDEKEICKITRIVDHPRLLEEHSMCTPRV